MAMVYGSSNSSLTTQPWEPCFMVFLGPALWTGFQDSKIYNNEIIVSLFLLLIVVIITVPATQYIVVDGGIIIYI
jgi:hypothetical protein